MREQHREIKERIFAIALSLFMILSMFPITVFAAEGSTISTNIGTVTAYRGMVTEFTVSVTPNDDAGKTVVGTFEFDDPDAVTGFEIYNAESGEWNEFPGTIGDGGISFDGADYLLRAIFTEKGDYTFTGSFKKSGTSDELCSVSQKFTVGEVCTVTSNLKDKTIVLGEATEFSVSTTKTAVIDPTSVSFVFEFDEATVGKLEYYDQNEKAWKEFVEVYAESGILLQNETYDFRATFVKMGENHIEVKVRKIADKNIISSKNDEIVANAKLSVSAGKGGSCTIDGDSVSSVNFCEESDFTVHVTPSEGFWITSVEIDDIEQTVSDPEGIELTLNNLSANANVVAEFVPIYTVSVTSNDNGTVDLPEGGSVTVASGSEVSVKATPSEGYRVAKVVVNKVESTFTDNDYVFEDSYIVEKPHDIVVTFAPNVYTVTAEKTVNGTVSVESDKVE